MADLSVDIAGGGGGGGAAAPSAAYYGYSPGTVGVSWPAIAWTPFLTPLPGWTDVTSLGISRTGSAWTVAAAGLYLLSVTACLGETTFRVFGIRARLAGATVAQQVVSVQNTAMLAEAVLHAPLSLADGAVLSLEYCTSAAITTVFAAAAMAGETSRIATVSLARVN